MTRSIQRSKCARSCGMCDPGKYEAGKAKASDRRRMQDDGGAVDYSPEEAAAMARLEEHERCTPHDPTRKDER